MQLSTLRPWLIARGKSGRNLEAGTEAEAKDGGAAYWIAPLGLLRLLLLHPG